jgi:nickel-dependent lactate racemase
MRDLASVHWDAIGPGSGSASVPAQEILRRALSDSPVLEPFLSAAAMAGEPILLLVNDGHRSTLTRPALTALAEFCRTLRAQPCFRALVATGTHRFDARERGVFEGLTFPDCGLPIEGIAWHDVTDAASLTAVNGMCLHRWMAESRFLLPIGSVEPHYFAGVTGAHKTVTIGCMARGDIERNHAGALQPESDVLRLHGNPVFDDIVECLGKLGSAGKTICAINEVIRGDEFVAAAVGDPLETLDELLPTVRRVYVRAIERPADVLRLRVPLPLGRNLYQADKALKNNHHAVRDGGGIVLEADCPEGIGPDAFMNLLRRAGDYATARQIVAQEGYRLGDHKAVKLRHLTDPAQRGVHVALVSPNVTVADVEIAGMSAFAEVTSAIDWLARVLTGPLERGLTVEDAGVVCVRPRSR